MPKTGGKTTTRLLLNRPCSRHSAGTSLAICPSFFFEAPTRSLGGPPSRGDNRSGDRPPRNRSRTSPRCDYFCRHAFNLMLPSLPPPPSLILPVFALSLLLSLSCSVHVCVRRLYPELVFWRNVFLASWLTESLIVLGVHHPDRITFPAAV